ncbi:L-serine dehydratase [Spironucleus salmonicida]|uniref:L-serine dehydratase n=1 Tax=Spironucleus salmonicida TaxID=348837 RepID=V6M151_9EUKA|nr:L-serine dehydratase [Spironucleus salmonicida]|eukprot:EST46899.1 L-serine dehydratase [Spironucleus salmonicida]
MACYEPCHRDMDSLRTLYKIGSGPSSSHTMGPKKAAELFQSLYPSAPKYIAHLYGSLALTGSGHKTDYAILQVLGDKCKIEWHMEHRLPAHTNGLHFQALDQANKVIGDRVWYSVGGGILEDGDATDVNNLKPANDTSESLKKKSSGNTPTFGNFRLFSDYVKYCAEKQMTLQHLVYDIENREPLSKLGLPKILMDQHLKGQFAHDKVIQDVLIQTHFLKCWETMRSCVEVGLKQTEDIDCGGILIYPRLAHKFYEKAKALNFKGTLGERFAIQAYALAVSENNGSAFHDVVTTPTCGACGVLPAILYFYYKHKMSRQVPKTIVNRLICDALAVAGVIGNICRANASVSGAEAGCQAEVGVACSMAAAAVVYLELKLCPGNDNVTLSQVLQMYEQAAKNALENLLGLTCDPIEGLVIAPCIQRNGHAALAAYNCGIIAVTGIFEYSVSFDEVVAIMYKTGKDMHSAYKETATGGHALMWQMDERANVKSNYNDYKGGQVGIEDLENDDLKKK